VIKFTTLFGLLAVEIAVKMEPGIKHLLAVRFLWGIDLRLPEFLRDADSGR